MAKLAFQGDVKAIERDEKMFGPIPDEILMDLGLERKAPTAEAPRSQSTDESNPCFAAEQAAKKNDSSQRSLRLSGENPLVRVWGTGTPKREFLYSEDMAQACVFIMENIDFPDLAKGLTEVRNTHINIGSGEDISIGDLAEMTKEVVVGFTGDLVFNSSKPDGTMRKLTDVSRLHEMGWKHKTSLNSGLQRFYEWYTKSDSSRPPTFSCN
ncbi:MAG: NAD-dependent epimerase/dehydratase family protein [Desulfovermiculus sp.]|nr:NAD-dependent epimerase/dehydratase family protein [Desulfovermiculus sp.]